MTPSELLRASIGVTCQIPVCQFTEKNPRLAREWQALLHHEYRLPTQSRSTPPNPTLDGTSSHTAAMFLYQCAQWPLLAICAREVFRGGVGHCAARDPVRLSD